jgi:TonB family protein
LRVVTRLPICIPALVFFLGMARATGGNPADPCEGAFVFADSINVTMHAGLMTHSAEERTPRRDAQRQQRILAAIRQRFHMPEGGLPPLERETPFSSMDHRPPRRGDFWPSILSVRSSVSFTLDSAGVLSDVQLLSHDYFASLTDSVASALRKAEADGALHGLVVPQHSRTSGRVLSTRRFTIDITNWRPDGVPSISLGELRLPRILAKPVVVQRREDPRYPEALLHRPGDVLLTFFVDTLGRAELHTIRVLRSSAPAFADASIAALRSWSFEPATVKGCRMRWQVQLPISFSP